jgi:hypothetical protein
MSNSQITIEQFRALALERFNFLGELGFLRALSVEETSPTGGTVVYLGKHVGFIFSLDVRDQCVDAQVVKVQDGHMKRNWEGGYSSNLFAHLVKHAGYRGRSRSSSEDSQSQIGETAIRRMIDEWVVLLRQAGQTLLNDSLDSFE